MYIGGLTNKYIYKKKPIRIRITAFLHLCESSVYSPTVILQDGNTILHKAVRRGELQMVELLLDLSNIDQSKKDKV